MPTGIEWCDETINPLGHGCYGPGGTKENPKICPYCYAHRLAKRGMRKCELCKKFIPHTHFEQLEKLKQWKNPRKIFVQSMGDLFHDETPDEWIQEVFKACEAAPQHKYLFLTKNFLKASDFRYQDNWWIGRTITNKEDSSKLCTGDPWSIDGIHRANHFLSIEPLLGDVEYLKYYLYSFKWVIIGQQTNPNKPPKDEWVQSIIDQCRAAGVPVFVKSPLYQQFRIQEWPEGLK